MYFGILPWPVNGFGEVGDHHAVYALDGDGPLAQSVELCTYVVT